MTRRGWAVVGVAWMLGACGGAQPPAEAPAPKAADGAAPKTQLESGPVTTSGEEAPPETATPKQALPCPGKNAKYWDGGLLKSERLTDDCEVNGHKYKAGELLEFDEEGQPVPKE